MIVEHGTGIHVFNGQPYTITGGTVCFVRDHDRHLYEHTDNIVSDQCTVSLAGSISVSRRAESVAATRAGWAVSVYWRVNQAYCSRCDSWLHRWNSRKGKMIYPRPPVARSYLCNYCSCCVKAVCRRTWKTAHHVSTCFWHAEGPILPMR